MKPQKKLLFSLLGMALSAIFFAWILNNWDHFSAGVGIVLRLFFPLILGFCMAFVLNIPMRFFERHLFPRAKNRALKKLRRPLCIVIALVVILTIITAVVLLVVPELVNAFEVLAKSIPIFAQAVAGWISKNLKTFPDLNVWLAGLQIDWANMGKELLSYVTNGAGSLLTGTVQVVSGIVGGVTNGVIAFIFALYMLLSKETLKAQLAAVCRAAFSEKLCEKIFFVAQLTKQSFSKYVAGQCTEACILGTLCWLGMTLLRFPYAPMVGALMGMMALIPMVGAFIGLAVGAFMIMMVSPIQAIWFIVFVLLLQQFEGNVVYPRVVGGSVGLPALWVLAAVTVGGGLWGIGGMLFAVPLCSVLYALARLAVHERLVAKGECPAQSTDAPVLFMRETDEAKADASTEAAAQKPAAEPEKAPRAPMKKK
ncbi:MAG: AI-2E family transporter [Ruthenibacterium sp.]